MKKYNNSTGCYRIELFVNGVYFKSTDQSKTCKQAVINCKKAFVFADTEKVTAHFYKY